MSRLYLLGHPIAHSKSPAMYNVLYQQLGLDWTYGLKDCATEEEAQTFLQAQEFLALNITTPYKPLAYQQAHIKTPVAQLTGGANMLAKKDSKLIAYNLDGEGCISFLENQDVPFANKNVVICGTGPTALSIFHAVSLAGAGCITLLTRDEQKGKAILEGYTQTLTELKSARAVVAQNIFPEGFDHPTPKEEWSQLPSEFCFSSGSYEDATKSIEAAHVIIDATPLGMNPGDKAPFDTNILRPDQTVCDIVYGHGETALVQAARARGCRTFDGAGMLVSQAVASARIQCELNNVELRLTPQELFILMADAAGFIFS